MQFRKLISFGKNSYVLSLPKDWIVSNKLVKGSMLSVDVHNDHIILSANAINPPEQEKKSITINLDGKTSKEIRLDIINAYILNYDILELIYKDKSADLGKIREIITGLAGMEIIDQTPNRIVIKYLIDPSEITPLSLLRRMDNITRSMFSDFIDSLEEKTVLPSRAPNDDDVNRLNFLIVRTARATFNSNTYLKGKEDASWKLYTLCKVSEQIEGIADCLKISTLDLWKGILPRSLAKDTGELVQQIKSAFSDVMKAYYTADKKLALKIELSHKEKLNACNELMTRYVADSAKNKAKLTSIEDHMLVAEVIQQLKTIIESINKIARTTLDT